MSNKINRIRNYNQVLLAIAGTIGIVLLVISSYVFIIEMWPRKFEENGMMANEEVEALTNQNLRKEIISFSEPELIDSIEKQFLIPVVTTDLEDLESMDKSLGLVNNFSGSYSKDLATNNLIVYNERLNISKIIFNKRLRISDYKILEIEKTKYVLIKGCKNDSNKDKYLNSEDLQKLFLYNLANGTVSNVKMPTNYTSLSIHNSYYTADHNIYRFGLDRNMDGFYDRTEEQTILMKLNVIESSMQNILSTEQLNKLQETLEGK